MKMYWGVGGDVWVHVFLTSALVGGEWSASRPGSFTPRERARNTHCIGSWVGLRAGLDDVEKQNFLTLPGHKLWALSLPLHSQAPYGLRCTQHTWLRHYSTNWKVAGSIPDEVIGFFSLLNPSSRNMALASPQPLTEMSTRNILEG
jgi:hypothetical protein